MSKSNNHPSLLAVTMHCLLVLMTGGLWLIPLGIYYGIKFVNNKNVNN